MSPLLCAYLMLYNEEDRIERTLRSCAPHIDGPILLFIDEKTTDKTQEIAENYLKSINKVYEVHTNKFQNYSQSRNDAFRLCSRFRPMAVFTMLIDANDEFENFKEIYPYLEMYRNKIKYTNFSVLTNISGFEFFQTIILRTNSDCSYMNNVHEHVHSKGRNANLQECEFIKFQDRTLDKDRPARILGDIEDLENRLKTAKSLDGQTFLTIVNQLSVCYPAAKQHENTIEMISKLFRFCNDYKLFENKEFMTSEYPYYQYCLGNAKRELKNPTYKKHFEEVLKYTGNYHAQCLMRLSECLLEDGEKEEAEKYLLMLLSIVDGLMVVNNLQWAGFQNVVLKYRRYKYAQEFVKRIYGENETPKLLFDKLKNLAGKYIENDKVEESK